MLEQLHDKLSSIVQNTSVWTVTTATIGGVYQSITQPFILLDAISIEGSISVIGYAFMSAAVGYCTKKAFDLLFQKRKRK
jgi:hypothetical protein